MGNITQKESQKLDETKVAADEIKVAVEEINFAAEPHILAIHGHKPCHYIWQDCKQVIQRLKEKLLGYQQNWSTDENCIDLESGLKTNDVVCKCSLVDKSPKGDGYGRSANDRIESVVKELKDEDNALKLIPAEMVKELKENGHASIFIPVETANELKNEAYRLPRIPIQFLKFKDDGYALKILPFKDYCEMWSRDMTEEVVDKSWAKRFTERFGYANDYIEKTVKPEMGLLFSGATMQNIYQLVTSGMVNTGKGKTLLKLNETAFMMLLYGLVMPRRAAGHIALAMGVALASTAYLVTLSFTF